MGRNSLLLVAIVFLEVAVQVILAISRKFQHIKPEEKAKQPKPIPQSILSGIKATLKSPYLLTVTGQLFFLLGMRPVLMVLVVFQVIITASNYALSKPTRESLFTVVDTESRYKAKSFIDTFVYRGAPGPGVAG